MRKGQFSTPVKVIIAVMILLAVAALLLAIARPQLFGFSTEANQTIMEQFKSIGNV